MIVRAIHQAWVGPKELPEREKAWCSALAAQNRDWLYCWHGNDLLERYAADPYVKFLADEAKDDPKVWAFVMDRLRCLLLRDEGGVYLDTDFQPVRPLNDLHPLWDLEHVTFVYGHRSPFRPGVALFRGVIAFIDNSFLASAPNSRMINRLLECWTPKNPRVNGGMIGRQILQYVGSDCVDTGHQAFYDMQKTPETIALHDPHNLSSWTGDPTKELPVARHGETIKV